VEERDHGLIWDTVQKF